jgi:hypothetical protein
VQAFFDGGVGDEEINVLAFVAQPLERERSGRLAAPGCAG